MRLHANPLSGLLFASLLASVLLAPARAADDDADKKKKAPEHKVTQSESYLTLDPIYTTIVADNRPAEC